MDPNVTCSFAGRTFELFCYLETLEASHIYEEKSNVFNYTRQSAMCSCINIGITNCSSRFNTNQGLPHNFCFGQFRNWHKFICWRIPSAKKKTWKQFFCVLVFLSSANKHRWKGASEPSTFLQETKGQNACEGINLRWYQWQCNMRNQLPPFFPLTRRNPSIWALVAFRLRSPVDSWPATPLAMSPVRLCDETNVREWFVLRHCLGFHTWPPIVRMANNVWCLSFGTIKSHTLKQQQWQRCLSYVQVTSSYEMLLWDTNNST